MALVPFRAHLARVVLVAFMLTLLALPAYALRVVTWNFMVYQSTNTVTPIASRQQAIRTVILAMQPDIVIGQEIDDIGGRDSLLKNVFNVLQPGHWDVQWIQVGSEGGAIYFDSTKVKISNFGTIGTGGPRPVIQALCKPVGYKSKGGWFRIYSMHLKAGNPFFTPSDSLTRRTECSSLRATLNNVNPTVVGTNFILAGDTNFYGDWEGGYQRLTEHQLNDNGRNIDPLSMPGTWNSKGAYAQYDTQCPQNTPTTSDFSGGGLDDRFDMILSSASMQDGVGLDYLGGGLPSGYGAFGNDGQHFNTDLNGGGFNTAVGYGVATALHDAADHIPVIVNLQLPAKIAAASQLDLGRVLVGATASASLIVSNSAAAPADLLRYSFAAPAGFVAPAGNFSVAAGGASGPHSIGMSTATTGDVTGTMTITTNDVDTTAKVVKLSGRVLAHAVASLDSATTVTNASLDLGDHAPGAFEDGTVRVYDKSFGTYQARLAVNAGTISGGAGRFKFPSGFTPALLSALGQTFNVHFDAAGATLDSTYNATLTFSSADEALPGGLAASDLIVQLRARPISGALGVGGDVGALRFLPPRPNPFTQATELAFELPHTAPVRLAIYDLNGRHVATLANGILGQGTHSLRWNAQDDGGHAVPAGLYFVRFQTTGLTRIARIALLP